MGSDLNSLTMDGQQVASSQSAGTGRQFEFAQASPIVRGGDLLKPESRAETQRR